MSPTAIPPQRGIWVTYSRGSGSEKEQHADAVQVDFNDPFAWRRIGESQFEHIDMGTGVRLVAWDADGNWTLSPGDQVRVDGQPDDVDREYATYGETEGKVVGGFAAIPVAFLFLFSGNFGSSIVSSLWGGDYGGALGVVVGGLAINEPANDDVSVIVRDGSTDQ